MRFAPVIAAVALLSGCSGPVDLAEEAAKACEKELTSKRIQVPNSLFPTEKQRQDDMVYFEVTGSTVICGVWIHTDGKVSTVTGGMKR